MAVTPREVITRVATLLQDIEATRWPTDELVSFLNDGQREVVMYRPDACTKTEQVTCIAGARQALPAGGTKLLSVRRTGGATQRALRMVSQGVLDAQQPSWYDLDETEDLLNYMYDPREPTVYLVYPPAAATAKLQITYAAYPEDVPPAGLGVPASGVTTTPMDLPDLFANALVDYVMYRALSKDAEYAGSAERAALYYAAFNNAMGSESAATVGAAPVPA